MAGSKTESLKFDPEDLTIGEMEDLEQAAGKSFGEIIRDFRTDMFSVSTIKAIVWVVKRRDDPGFTLEQAREVKASLLFASTNGDSPSPPA